MIVYVEVNHSKGNFSLVQGNEVSSLRRPHPVFSARLTREPKWVENVSRTPQWPGCKSWLFCGQLSLQCMSMFTGLLFFSLRFHFTVEILDFGMLLVLQWKVGRSLARPEVVWLIREAICLKSSGACLPSPNTPVPPGWDAPTPLPPSWMGC